MSPELCISAVASANAKLKPGVSTYVVFGLEYGRECWGATSLLNMAGQTSLAGDRACTMACSGLPNQASCGGRNMYDYYVPSTYKASLVATSVPVSTTGTVKSTSTAK